MRFVVASLLFALISVCKAWPGGPPKCSEPMPNHGAAELQGADRAAFEDTLVTGASPVPGSATMYEVIIEGDIKGLLLRSQTLGDGVFMPANAATAANFGDVKGDVNCMGHKDRSVKSGVHTFTFSAAMPDVIPAFEAIIVKDQYNWIIKQFTV